MLFYSLVNADCHETVDIYLSRDDALADLAAALRDEPDWHGLLSVVPLDLLGSASARPSAN